MRLGKSQNTSGNWVWTIDVFSGSGNSISPVINTQASQAPFTSQLTIEFFDDENLTIPSTDVTGTVTIQAKPSYYSEWQTIIDAVDISDVSNRLINISGVVNYLQATFTTITNANYANFIYDYGSV
jgi:hypothetical protein